MKKRASDIQFKVGLFIFLGLIVFFIFIFSQGKLLQGRGYDLKIVYTYIAGLDPGAPVRVSGYRVGEVKNIDLVMNKNQVQIIVTARLNPKIRLGKNSRFLVRNYGIIGEKYLEILPTDLNDQPIIQPGEIVQGEDPLPMERFLSTGEDILKNLNNILASLNDITKDERLKSQITQIASETKNLISQTSTTINSFNSLALNWNTTASEINSLISENRDKINSSVTHLDHTLIELDNTLSQAAEQFAVATQTFTQTNHRINRFIDKLENQGLFADIITDTEIARDIRETIAGLKDVSTNLNVSFIKLAYASDQLGDILSDIRSGKGTVGKLIAKDDLYNQIFEMVQDLKAHPWKILFRERGQ
ncbi:MAG TPA: MlaD family protein [bacterium]|nr:MlaD family protein [bacterium]